MAFGINSKCPGELSSISAVTREWGEEFLSSEEVGFLRRLPLNNNFSIDSMNFELIHGIEVDPQNFTGILCSKNFDQESERSFILTGHSHKPYIKTFGNRTILNPGSAGQPRDLNPRASYAVIEDGIPYIRRVSYDIERTVNDLERSTLPKLLTHKLTAMLYSGGLAN